jgi:hypothetical protein
MAHPRERSYDYSYNGMYFDDYDDFSEYYQSIRYGDMRATRPAQRSVIGHVQQDRLINNAYEKYYPIHISVPDEPELLDLCAIKRMNINNIQNFASMSYPTKRVHVILPDGPCINEEEYDDETDIIINFANSENTNLDPILEYNPFDIIYHIGGTHMHGFTREEWSLLLSNKKNLWTQVELPNTVINEIKHRQSLVNKYKLSDPLPYSVRMDNNAKKVEYLDFASLYPTIRIGDRKERKFQNSIYYITPAIF